MHSDLKEFEADLRNKLTMPLTVLNEYAEGKVLSKNDIFLAIKSLHDALNLLEKNGE
ncbi:MAG: hypothetical protein K8S27_07315 [Candidatus Omnitrophica bacterium]|nr:hypothetical protein [Candidatus Omnitrophota bacterium]